MTDLPEFLHACITQDELVANAATPGPWFANLTTHGDPSVVLDLRRPAFTTVATVSCSPADYGRANNAHIAAWSPSRVLAECDAKRKIVTEASKYLPGQHGFGMAQSAMKFLTLTYADRPGYQEEWAN